MGDFEVGDIIKGISENKYGITDTRMTKAIVLEKRNEHMRIKVIDHTSKYYIGHKYWVENNNKFFEKCAFDVILEKDDGIDALRYCIDDLITTNNCCEKIKEEKDMNKVVTLWYERKRKSIEKKYDKLRKEFGEKQYGIIESFNELVDKFNNDLDGLFQLDKASEQFVLVNNAPNNVIKYKIDVNKLDDEFNEMYRDEIRKAYDKIDDTREEVEAQLSLSDDLKYQQEVLERYGIISKKTKKISD